MTNTQERLNKTSLPFQELYIQNHPNTKEHMSVNMDEIKKGDYVVFKSGESMISEDKRLETRFLVALVNESIAAINILGICLVAVGKDRLELAPNQGY